jgi:hypothetical protein
MYFIRKRLWDETRVLACGARRRYQERAAEFDDSQTDKNAASTRVGRAAMPTLAVVQINIAGVSQNGNRFLSFKSRMLHIVRLASRIMAAGNIFRRAVFHRRNVGQEHLHRQNENRCVTRASWRGIPSGSGEIAVSSA